ncbi:MAG TPA: DUF362 domain-containing protein [Anaeromyxobacteraceae bacterium]|nr:DUF362 domain-containing protein [Anaeromyxobacteraceae bacterium]
MSGSENIKIVSLIRCNDYDRENVFESVRQSLDRIGGVGVFVRPGQAVFLKFNMLLGAHPDKCVSTHPEIVHAVARILKSHGCTIVMGDSPGSGLPYNERVLRKAYAASGFDRIAEDLAIPLNYDTGSREISAPQARMTKRFRIIRPALDCDAIVVVSKAKTHGLTYVTGAAKNLFGVIPGFEKPTYHATLPNSNDFSRMILDLNALLKPQLHIMDAVMGMEGDGPHSGTPRKIGAVLASGDSTAIDVALSRLMSIEPRDVPTIKMAIERGLAKPDLSDISVVGEAVDDMAVKDFKRPTSYRGSRKDGVTLGRMAGWLSSLVKDYAPRPKIVAEKCVGCLRCVRSCPTRTISATGKIPRIAYGKCIKCYCCHEMCESHAILLKRSIWGTLVASMVDR